MEETMAVTKILSKTMRLDKLIRYVVNKDKTEEQTLVSCIGCEASTAAKTMMDTKRHYGKTDGVQAYHIIQSFKPDEISPALAHELGNRFAMEYLDGYEVVIGTHVDKDHIHNHIAFNSVSDATGLKYHSSPESYYKGIRAISDALCKEYGLSVIMETGGKGLNYAEWKMRKAGLMTYRELVDTDVREALSLALDIGNFYEIMEDRGYTVEHHSKYPTFIPYGSKGNFRAKANGKSLTEDDIRTLIERGFEEHSPQSLMPKQRKEFVPFGKQKGFRALYVSWMYVLGIIGKGGKTQYTKATYADVKRFEQYKAQADYLEEHKIDTAEQLESRKVFLTEQIDMLTKERIILNQKKRRRKNLYDAASQVEYYSELGELYKKGLTVDKDEYRIYLNAKKLLSGQDISAVKQEKTDVYTRLSDINAELRKVRSEIRLCERIEKNTKTMAEKLNAERQAERKEEREI